MFRNAKGNAYLAKQLCHPLNPKFLNVLCVYYVARSQATPNIENWEWPGNMLKNWEWPGNEATYYAYPGG